MRSIAGLREIAGCYAAFIVDLWGVVHDGIAPYPAALACLAALRGRPLLLLSNAPRRAASARRMLQRMGVADDLYTGLLTSGEAVWLALHERTDPWFARLGQRVYHLGPQRDRNLIEGLGLVRVDAPREAAFVLNTGPDDDMNDPGDLQIFVAELEACLRAGLPMICANPDLVVIRGGARILCAGTLAEFYRLHGGDVAWRGKPDPAIYRLALERMQVGDGRSVLAIGDSLHTDIAGATAAGLDSLWVLGGIHQEEVAGAPSGAAAIALDRGLHPVAAIDKLRW